jgi:hypothetical protein
MEGARPVVVYITQCQVDVAIEFENGCTSDQYLRAGITPKCVFLLRKRSHVI